MPGEILSEAPIELPPGPVETEAPPRRLSEELTDLSYSVKDEDLTLLEFMDRMEGRVYTLLLIFLSLPACQPIVIPGLSMPFGIVIALLGLRFAMREKPWLPQRILQLKLPSKFLPGVLRAGARILSWIEKLSHPRMTGMFEYRATQFVAGVIIFVCGVFLLLPLPIPFSNLLPSLTVILIAMSLSERDGVLYCAGLGMFVVTLVFFSAIFWGGTGLVVWLEQHFSGIFDPNDEVPILPIEP